MYPVLYQIGDVKLQSYSLFLLIGCILAWNVRKIEVQRLQHTKLPNYPWVSVSALMGAVLGSKLGMLMFTQDLPLEKMLNLDFTGKTIVGGLMGGFIGVEIGKKIIGIQQSTGDAFAVALPLAQGIGRIGCFLHGCCYGTHWDGPWAIEFAEELRHPTALYESVLDLLLAGYLWKNRFNPYPQGHLFRRYLVGYAMIRFFMDFFRGDPSRYLGPLTMVQVVCLLSALIFGSIIWHREKYPES